MKCVHTISLSVFANPEEDQQLIKETLLSLIGLEKDKIVITERHAQGFNERSITIFSVNLSKTRHTKTFLAHLNSQLTIDQRELLIRQAYSRMDEEFNFHIRLDKTSLMDGIYRIVDHGNCFHIKIKLACYPKKLDTALRVLEKVFS